MAESTNVLRAAPTGSEGVPGRSGFTREIVEDRREGRSGLVAARSRLYMYDRVQGVAQARMQVTFDKEDRMPVSMALEKLDELHRTYGVERSMEGFLYDFDYAMQICYAINGGSQVGPHGRVKFYVHRDGVTSDFDYSVVSTVLGVDLRRFFRTYANDVVDSCRHMYNHCNYEDPDQVESRAMMIQLADHRGISRYPWLIADCADAATNLSMPEAAALAISKQLVIGASTNAVDRRNLAIPVRSSDNYDSSLSQSVPNSNDIHAQGSAVGYYK